MAPIDLSFLGGPYLLVLFLILDLLTAARIGYVSLRVPMDVFERLFKMARVFALANDAVVRLELIIEYVPPRTFSWVPLMLALHINTWAYLRLRSSAAKRTRQEIRKERSAKMCS